MLLNVTKKNLLPVLRCACAKPRLNFTRNYQASLDTDDFKTTIQVLNKQQELGLMIDSYSQVGFRVNTGVSLLGSIAILPRAVLSWKVTTPEQIDIESLSLFFTLYPKIEILVVGYGDKTPTGSRISHKVISELQRSRIYTEILPTEVACSTFNFLVAERRTVAGVFIPPRKLHVHGEGIIQAMGRDKRAFELDITKGL